MAPMRTDTKNIAFISIVVGGFILILFLWLPTFAENIQSMTQGMNLSSSKIMTDIKKQSDGIFEDAREEITKNIERMEQEKQQQDALRAAATDILKEQIRAQQPHSPKSTSSSKNTISTTPVTSSLSPSSSPPIIP